MMEYQVNAASSSGSGNHKVPKENIKPPSEGKMLKDRISELPAETIDDILSQLKTKEAGSTSILSRGWRYKWTTVYNLEFDGSKVSDDVERKIKCLEVEIPIFVSRVNEVVGRHQGQSIDQFAVVFTLGDSFRTDIDGWVGFSVRKKVQRLKLDLRNGRYTAMAPYSFPNSLEISSCRSLTSLHLDNVNITGEMLELFLYNCLNLERVFVSCSLTLLSLNVHGSLLKLKWLELYRCHNIKWLNVSAPNLVSFKYTGPIIPMPFKYVPKILEISILGPYGYYFNSRLSDLSRSIYLSRLEKLTLTACVRLKRKKDGPWFPLFPKLKYLTLVIDTIGFESIVDYASLIRLCPYLYYFSFETWVNFKSPSREPSIGVLTSTSNTIRVVEFKGFRGNDYEVEMGEYLIENAVMLEKITFDTVSPAIKGKWKEFDEPPSERQISARECARELGKRLCPSVELVIV